MHRRSRHSKNLQVQYLHIHHHTDHLLHHQQIRAPQIPVRCIRLHNTAQDQFTNRRYHPSRTNRTSRGLAYVQETTCAQHWTSTSQLKPRWPHLTDLLSQTSCSLKSILGDFRFCLSVLRRHGHRFLPESSGKDVCPEESC